MTNIRILSRILLSAVAVAMSFVSCSKEPVEKEPEFNVSGIILPQQIEGAPGSEVQLRVVGGNGPAKTDKVELAGDEVFTADISDVQSGSFTFVLPADIYFGDYTVSILRGSKSKRIGKTRLVVSSAFEIDPQGASVYGQVLSKGRGVQGVAVSDGYDVVVTDKDGVYRLQNSKKTHGYVFMSVPSGYEPVSEGILPVMHHQLSQPADTPERADFVLLPAAGQDDATVLMIGDIHLASRTKDREQFSAFVQDINAFRASLSGKVYGITLGDMTWDLFWKVNNYSYAEYLQDAGAIKNLTIYHTIGNHDHSMYEAGDFNSVKEYKKLVAPTYYSFNIGKAHYVVLDDVECTNSKASVDEKGNPCYERSYTGNLVDEQLSWLRKDLALVSADTPLVVMMHIPLRHPDGGYAITMSSAGRLEEILSGYQTVHLYTGHTHTVYNLPDGNLYEHNAGAVCGTWWWSNQETPGVHIGPDGSPGGYAIFKASGKNFSWQFKATGSPLSYQMRSYDRNNIHITTDKYVPQGDAAHKAAFDPGIWASASSANEVYVNVWNWDPSWKVEMKEGSKKLDVTRVSVKDPLHLIAYTAKRLNVNNRTREFETSLTRHMFKAVASSASSTIDITVTDRFGNVYTETMTRPKAFEASIYVK